MALREPVLAEAADLLKGGFGELGLDALRDHALDEAVVVLLDATAPPPGGHVAAQLVGLAGGVVGGDDGELHHLFLEDGHAQGFREHRLERRVRVDHLLLAGAATEVGVHHPAGDRPGPDDAHLDHDVVPDLRPQPRQHRHLRAALELEDAHRVAAPDHPEYRRVVVGDRRHGEVDAAVLFEQSERVVEMGERAQPQQIDLEEVHVLHVVLVPLDDGAVGHRRVLDRHQPVDRLASQQEATGVDGEVAREVEDLAHEPAEELPHPLAHTGRVEHLLQVAVAAGGELRHPVERGRRQVEHLAHVADRALHAVADHVRDHRRTFAPVLRVDVLDHLLATPVLDIQVYIRRFGALAAEKPLEEQVHPNRVDRGHPEAVTHRRVGRRPPALREDALPFAVLDDLPHREEVAAVLELVDERELLLQLRAHVGRDGPAVALPCAGEGELPEPFRCRVAGRHPLLRIAVLDLLEAECGPPGDLQGAGYQLRSVAVALGHLFFRKEPEARVRRQPRACLVERDTVADAGEHVVQLAPVRAVVEHLRSGDEGYAVPAREVPESAIVGGVAGTPVPGVSEVERVTEGVAEGGERALLGGGRSGRSGPPPGPHREKPAGVLADLVDRHDALPLGRASPPGADEPAQAGVALAVLGEEDERGGPVARRAGLHRHFRPHDEPRTRIGLQLADRLLRLDYAVHAVAIGERDRRQLEARGLRDELVRMAAALEETVVALHPQRGVVATGTAGSAHSTTPWTSHRSSAASK